MAALRLISASRYNRAEKMRRSVAAARAANPLDSAVATGVTQAVAGSYDTVTLTKYVDVLTKPGQFEYRGGKRTVSGGGTATYPVASILPAVTGGNLGADKQAWGWSETFETEAAKLAIHMFSSASTGKGFRILVDGKYINKSVVNYGVAAGSAYVTLDFSSVRAPRRITIEGSVQDGFRGVYVPPTEEVWRPRSVDKVIWLAAGDSYSEGQGSAYPGQLSWVQHAAKLLFPEVDLRQVAVGGTGYVNVGGTRSRAIDQISNWFTVNSDITADDVDLVTIPYGYNDYASGASAVAAVLAAEFAAVRAAVPNAQIDILGTWSGLRNNDATTLAIETAVSAAVTTFADARSRFIAVSSDTPSWQTGTGKVGATTGAGNGDFDLSSDGVHPSDAGHMMIGRRYAAGFTAL